MTCAQNTIGHWKEKFRKIQISGSIYHIHGYEELTYLKCAYYPKQCVDSTPFLSRFQWHIYRTRTNISKMYMEPQKGLYSNMYPEKNEQSWSIHTT